MPRTKRAPICTNFTSENGSNERTSKEPDDCCFSNSEDEALDHDSSLLLSGPGIDEFIIKVNQSPTTPSLVFYDFQSLQMENKHFNSEKLCAQNKNVVKYVIGLNKYSLKISNY